MDPGGLIAGPGSPHSPSTASPVHSKPRMSPLSSCLDQSWRGLTSKVVHLGHKGAEMPMGGTRIHLRIGDVSSGRALAWEPHLVWFNGPMSSRPNKGLTSFHSLSFPLQLTSNSLGCILTASLFFGPQIPQFSRCPATKELEHCVPWALSLPAPEASASLLAPFIGGYCPKECPVYWPPSYPSRWQRRIG